jgi:hypothetical protein
MGIKIYLRRGISWINSLRPKTRARQKTTRLTVARKLAQKREAHMLAKLEKAKLHLGQNWVLAPRAVRGKVVNIR